MNLRRLFLGLYWLVCSGCGRRAFRLGESAAMATAYDHDDRCEVLCAWRTDADRLADLVRQQDEDRLAAELRDLTDQERAAELRVLAVVRRAAVEAATACGWDAEGIDHDVEEGCIERHRDDCPGCLLLAKTERWGSLLTPRPHDATTPINNL